MSVGLTDKGFSLIQVLPDPHVVGSAFAVVDSTVRETTAPSTQKPRPATVWRTTDGGRHWRQIVGLPRTLNLHLAQNDGTGELFAVG